MSKLTADVRVQVDGNEVHTGTVTVDTEDTGTPWMQLMAGMVDEGRAAHDKANGAVTV